jgi:hypothetical protein
VAAANTLQIFTNTPSNTSELRQMCDQARRHYHAQGDAVEVVAADLQTRLSRLPGSPLLFGLDSKAVARRITKHLKLASELNAQSARAFVACYSTYAEYILNTQDAARAGFQI